MTEKEKEGGGGEWLESVLEYVAAGGPCSAGHLEGNQGEKGGKRWLDAKTPTPGELEALARLEVRHHTHTLCWKFQRFRVDWHSHLAGASLRLYDPLRIETLIPLSLNSHEPYICAKYAHHRDGSEATADGRRRVHSTVVDGSDFGVRDDALGKGVSAEQHVCRLTEIVARN